MHEKDTAAVLPSFDCSALGSMHTFSNFVEISKVLKEENKTNILIYMTKAK